MLHIETRVPFERELDVYVKFAKQTNEPRLTRSIATNKCRQFILVGGEDVEEMSCIYPRNVQETPCCVESMVSYYNIYYKLAYDFVEILNEACTTLEFGFLLLAMFSEKIFFLGLHGYLISQQVAELSGILYKLANILIKKSHEKGSAVMSGARRSLGQNECLALYFGKTSKL